eukprot:2243525-Rhodomonas_salina.1
MFRGASGYLTERVRAAMDMLEGRVAIGTSAGQVLLLSEARLQVQIYPKSDALNHLFGSFGTSLPRNQMQAEPGSRRRLSAAVAQVQRISSQHVMPVTAVKLLPGGDVMSVGFDNVCALSLFSRAAEPAAGSPEINRHASKSKTSETPFQHNPHQKRCGFSQPISRRPNRPRNQQHAPRFLAQTARGALSLVFFPFFLRVSHVPQAVTELSRGRNRVADGRGRAEQGREGDQRRDGAGRHGDGLGQPPRTQTRQESSGLGELDPNHDCRVAKQGRGRAGKKHAFETDRQARVWGVG